MQKKQIETFWIKFFWLANITGMLFDQKSPVRQEAWLPGGDKRTKNKHTSGLIDWISLGAKIVETMKCRNKIWLSQTSQISRLQGTPNVFQKTFLIWGLSSRPIGPACARVLGKFTPIHHWEGHPVTGEASTPTTYPTRFYFRFIHLIPRPIDPVRFKNIWWGKGVFVGLIMHYYSISSNLI